MTKLEMFAILKTTVESSETIENKQELLDAIAHEVSLVEKKNSSDRKETKTQAENELIKLDILDFMQDGKSRTISQILKSPKLSEFSNQKISALASQLVKEKKIKREVEKRVSFFTIEESAKVKEVGKEEEVKDTPSDFAELEKEMDMVFAEVENEKISADLEKVEEVIAENDENGQVLADLGEKVVQDAQK